MKFQAGGMVNESCKKSEFQMTDWLSDEEVCPFIQQWHLCGEQAGLEKKKINQYLLCERIL